MVREERGRLGYGEERDGGKERERGREGEREVWMIRDREGGGVCMRRSCVFAAFIDDARI